MIPATLADLLSADPIAPLQRAIVATVKTLLPGVAVAGHPGKVDVSELIARKIAPAPSVTIGWSRARRMVISDGHYSMPIEWTAYIAAEPRVIDTRRVEADAIAFAIGARLLAILADQLTPLWGMDGVLPPEESPAPEFKPLFTVKDGDKGVYYYTVTWTQGLAALGASFFPGDLSHLVSIPGEERVDIETAAIQFVDADALARAAAFFPAEEDDDAE